MTTRKAIALVNGLFQEVNTPTDGIDFAGNSTSDLTEGTNLYYTDTRARLAISVTDSGGDGSLSYDNSTGVITYVGPSASEVRAHLSVAAGSGLTYNSTTGEFGTNAIPNSQLANSSLTVGSTNIALGATETTIAGLSSLTSTTLVASTTLNVGAAGAANSIQLDSTGIIFEGATADANTTTLAAADATAVRLITLPDATGTVALLSTLSATTSGTGYGSLSYDSGTGTFTYSVVTDANIRGTISVTDSGGDGSLTYDNSTGVITYVGPSASDVRAHFSVAVGSGLTYNSTTGEFGTSAIPNSQLQNSSFTLGSTSVALGSTATTIAGLLSLTSDAIYVTTSGSANGITLDTSGITFEGSTADANETLLTVEDPTGDRTFTIPDESGIAATRDFATAIAIALG
jgi:hypothetical protein